MGAIEVTTAAGYELRTKVLHAGTRSEGRIGSLFLDGVAVPPPPVGTSIDVPTVDGVVTFTYQGEERPHLWTNSGWTVHPA